MSLQLETADAEAARAGVGAPRVTLQSMLDKVANVAYHAHDHLTVCIVTMKNGFFVVGKSAPASPENFNAEYGMKLAHEDCIRQLWSLEGYALREKLSTGGA